MRSDTTLYSMGGVRSRERLETFSLSKSLLAPQRTSVSEKIFIFCFEINISLPPTLVHFSLFLIIHLFYIFAQERGRCWITNHNILLKMNVKLMKVN